MTNFEEKLQLYTELKNQFYLERNARMFNFFVTKIELLKIAKRNYTHQQRL